MISVNERIKEAINRRAPEQVILREARMSGASTLAESAMKKVAEGLTTLQEIEKIIPMTSLGSAFQDSAAEDYSSELTDSQEISYETDNV